MAKSARMDLRLHPDDDDLIRRAALHLHESVNAFVARVARREAAEMLLERTFATLEADEFDKLEARFDHTPQPDERLLALMKAPDPWGHGRPGHHSA